MINKLKSAGITIVGTLVVAFFFSLFKSENIKLSGIERYAEKISTQESRQVGFTLLRNKQYTQARAFFELAANKGDIPSQVTLATLYYYDTTVDQHFKIAYQWFSKNSDHPMAQYYLSLMYHMGDYVTKNPQLALYWQQKAAYQSLPVAQYNQAVMYSNNQQYAEAFIWASYARNNDFSRAHDLVKQSEGHLTPQQKALAQQQYNVNKSKHIWQGESSNSFSALLEGEF
jgi:TPR repeat protein